MSREIKIIDWGPEDYAEALERQQGLFDRLTALSLQGGGAPTLIGGPSSQEEAGAGWLIFCEHPHVYTLGRSGRSENLLVTEEWLAGKGASLHRIGRGGDITYHGPGQVVCYPIVDLTQLGLGLREYIAALEQAVIETVAQFGVTAERIEGKTGVWVSSNSPSHCGTPRKICAIGVRASRGVVMHGLALNVSTDLGWFAHINPCGMAGAAVTSLNAETGRNIDPGEVKKVLAERLRVIMNHES